MSKMKILQLFGWRWEDISKMAKEIAFAGWTHVLVTPCTPTKDENSHEFWQYYQPLRFEVGNNLGTCEEWIYMCLALKSYGVEVIQDVVLRHLAGDDYGNLIPHEKCDQGICARRDFWLQPINSSNDNDRWQQTHRCFGMQALNYFNDELVDNVYMPFLDFIMKYASGLRIDMGKHFALPYEDGAPQFWNKLKNRYGEENLIAECLDVDQHMFNNYATYTNVLTNIRPCENEDKAVVFCESHDTYYTFKSTCHMSNYERMQEYRLLVHRYDKVLYFARPYDDTIFSDEIRFINIHC